MVAATAVAAAGQAAAEAPRSPPAWSLCYPRAVLDGLRFARDKLGVLRDQLPYLVRAVGLVRDAAGRLSILWLAVLTVEGLLPAATVFLTRALVDSLVAATQADAGLADARRPLLLAVAMAAVLILVEVLKALHRWIRTAQGELVRDHIQRLIHQRALAADLAYYESPLYYDQLHRARSDAQGRPLALVESLGGLLQASLTLAAMAAVLAPFGWWVPVALAVSTAPALYVVLRFALLQHAWQMRTTEDRRRTSYLDWVLTARESAPELRVFRLGEHFSAAFQALRAVLRRQQLDLTRSEAVTEIKASVFALAVSGLALGLMVVRTVRGELSLGELAMFAQAFNQGQHMMRSLLAQVGQIYSNVLFLENLFEFLELRPRLEEPTDPVPLPTGQALGIRFKQVGFRYPDAKRSVFEHLDLEIPAGRIVALLGVNGAGKSTLFKLLCRLYDPSSGAVEIGGVDLRAVAGAELRHTVTVLFQEPFRYAETVRRNVELGRLDPVPSQDEVLAALGQADAAAIVSRLPEGAETMLSRWFSGGTELSLGEWQRVALARSLVRDARILLLDEPTSAMDSWAENDWVEHFRDLARGRTAVVITHRLTTARRADLIHVIDGGVLVESGTHDQLLAAGGAYASSWRRQVEGLRAAPPPSQPPLAVTLTVAPSTTAAPTVTPASTRSSTT